MVSANNYNSNKVISKCLSSANEFYNENTNGRESKSTEKHIVYHNYMSNQNLESKYEYQNKKYKKFKSKRGSCKNSKVDSHNHSSISKLSISLNDKIMNDRGKLIKYIKLYCEKNEKIPPTTLDYYKIVKLIGKGAFGKVTLGIHKLTGKQVAIKTIEKAYIKDDFSRRKVFQEVYILK